VLLDAYCEVTPVGTVSRRCFLPAPKIDSTILSCVVRKPPIVSSDLAASLRTVVKAAFATRRKTILNSMSGAPGLDLSKETVAKILTEVVIAPGARAEAVTTAQFLALAAALPK
jgi:16S rRNA (adenine1518-N6/adenine1519-N6)-dimethyltransferase